MSLSRGLNLFKKLEYLRKPANVLHNVQQIRNSGMYSYRCGAYPPSGPLQKYGGDILAGIMWWWILWHFWHESGHVIGEFEYPDPSKWTDAELGIPPDDE